MNRAEVVVVGGGLAGAAAAITLARGGRSVTLLEREKQAVHKVCGEFLSVETVAMLAELGIDVWALGAERIDRVRVAAGRSVSEARLPFVAASLTRRTLDECLLAQAARAGVAVQRGAAVQTLEPEGGRWRVRLTGGETIEAADVVLATGKHDMRGRARQPGRQDDLVAFKMYWRLAPAQGEQLREHVELMLFGDGYAGLQMVEHDAANLCCVIRKRKLRALGGDWPRVLDHMMSQCALLRERMGGAHALLEKPLAVSAIPYGMVRRETQPGLWCVGDQAAVIPSFTGDGMAIALRSGMLAAETMLGGGSAQEFQHALAKEVEHQVGFATNLSRAMVHSAAQTASLPVLRLWPAVLGRIARLTRLHASVAALR